MKADMKAEAQPDRLVGRWVVRVLVGAVLVVLGYLVVNAMVTQFGAGSGANLLFPVVFFAAPLLLVGAVPMVLARRSLRLPVRLLFSAAVAWLVFVGLRWLLVGRTWVWVPFDLMPPLLLVLVPLLLLGAILVLWLAGLRPAGSVLGCVGLCAVLALVAGAGGAGLNPRALWPGHTTPAPASSVRVMSWDSYQWNTGHVAQFYRYVLAQHADVYLFQDYYAGDPLHPRPAHDEAQLRAEFPGYYLASAGGLLTVSRFPIVAQTALDTGAAPAPGFPGDAWPQFWRYRTLRTDILVNGRVLSVYNVHLFDLFFTSFNPLSAAFYQSVHGLDERRQQQFAALRADIAHNPNPVVVSGNLNALPGMRGLSFPGMANANSASDEVYPASLYFVGVRLWQMDWTFSTPNVVVHSYQLSDPQGMSTHDAQNFVLSLR